MTPNDNPTIPFGFCQCGCGQKTKIAPITRKDRGEIRGQPKRHLKGHWTSTEANRINMRRHGHCADGVWTGVYRTWAAMMGRCYSKSNTAYLKYGAKGISVCERWHLFENFLEDMGPRPYPRATIERKDYYGNYEPSNCKWATYKEQANNRRSNRRVEYRGTTYTLQQLSESINMPQSKLLARLDHGWTVEDAVNR